MRMSVWDKPRVIGCAENFPQHIALPRGCMEAALSLLHENGIACDLRDERVHGQPLEVELRWYSAYGPGGCRLGDATSRCRCAVRADCLRQDSLRCRDDRSSRCNTLVLVHRTELLKQWQERLQVFLALEKGVVGVIGGGKARPTGKIDIAVMQSLSRQGEVNPLVENYGQVIVDECHHVGAVSFDAILRRTKAKYVLGLTATPIRRDGQQPIIFMQCGPIRYTAARPASAPRDLEVVPRFCASRASTCPRRPAFRTCSVTSPMTKQRTDAIAAEVAGRSGKAARYWCSPSAPSISTPSRPPWAVRFQHRWCCTAGCRRSSAQPSIAELDALPRCPAHSVGHRQTGRRRLRSSSAGHLGAGDAGLLERHPAAVRGASPSGARRQGRRADHRFRRIRSSGVAADVGEAAARPKAMGYRDAIEHPAVGLAS